MLVWVSVLSLAVDLYSLLCIVNVPAVFYKIPSNTNIALTVSSKLISFFLTTKSINVNASWPRPVDPLSCEVANRRPVVDGPRVRGRKRHGENNEKLRLPEWEWFYWCPILSGSLKKPNITITLGVSVYIHVVCLLWPPQHGNRILSNNNLLPG